MILVACLGRTPRFGLDFLFESEPTPAAAATPQGSSSSSLCIDDGEPATVISTTMLYLFRIPDKSRHYPREFYIVRAETLVVMKEQLYRYMIVIWKSYSLSRRCSVREKILAIHCENIQFNYFESQQLSLRGNLFLLGTKRNLSFSSDQLTGCALIFDRN